MTKDKNDCKDVAIYLRLSRNEEKLGIDEVLSLHKERLIEHCHNKGYAYTIYQEIISGMSESRPEFKKMLENIQAGLHCKVLVVALDRLSRNTKVLLDVWDTFSPLGIILETPFESIDTSIPANKLMFTIRGAVSEQEWYNIRDRLALNKLQTAKRGKNVTRTVYGYNTSNGVITINEDESKIVRIMIDMLLSGKSLTDVALHVNSLGVSTRQGNKFRENTVHRIVSNRMLLGEINYQDKVFNKEVSLKDCHPALMSYEEFNEIQQLLKSRVKLNKSIRNRGKIKAPIQKLVICGVCGSIMQFNSKKMASGNEDAFIQGCHQRPFRENNNYCPNKGIKVATIMPFIYTELKKRSVILRQDVSSLLTESTSGEKERIEVRVAEINKALADKREENKELAKMRMKKQVDEELYAELTKDLAQEVNSLAHELERYEHKLQSLSTQDHISRLEEKIEMLTNLESKSLEQQNNILKIVIDKIIFTRLGDDWDIVIAWHE
nr:recombinase family protein [Niallia taxi]